MTLPDFTKRMRDAGHEPVAFTGPDKASIAAWVISPTLGLFAPSEAPSDALRQFQEAASVTVHRQGNVYAWALNPSE